MIQAASDTSSQSAPLKGRLLTLTAEVDGLEGRIGALKTEVGAEGGGAAEEPPALLEKGSIKTHGVSSSSALFSDYSVLLRSKNDLGSLKLSVSDLEKKMGTVKSDIQLLENQVSGNAFAAVSLLAEDADIADDGDEADEPDEAGEAEELVAPSLLAIDAHKEDGSSLESRTVALEREVAEARSRVTSIEQVVVG